MNTLKLIAVLTAMVILFGCSSSDSNKPPTVSVSPLSVQENTLATVSAQISDEDGSISKILWQQISGSPVVLMDSDKAQVQFTAPIVTEESILQLKVTATDNDGATTSATVNVTITINELELKLSGKVKDSPLTDALVTFQINDKLFETITDEQGDYTLTITIDDSYFDNMIKAVATKTINNQNIKLVSYLGSVEQVIARQQGSDIDKDDLLNVNITHLTTAFAALFEDYLGKNVETVDEYHLALRNYDNDYALYYATAIKLITDYSEQNSSLELPNDISDTFQLLQNKNIIADYIFNARSLQSTHFFDALDETFNDIDFMSIGSENIEVINNYYGLAPRNFRSTDRITLSANGEGFFWSSFGRKIPITWLASENGIDINYLEDFIVSESYQLDNQHGQVLLQTVRVQSRLNWLMRTEEIDHVLLTHERKIQYANNEYPPQNLNTEFENFAFIKQEAKKDILPIIELGKRYSFTVPLETIENTNQQSPFGNSPHLRNAFEVIFNGDSNTEGVATATIVNVLLDGTVERIDKEFNWSIDENQRLNLTNEVQSFQFTLLKDDEEKLPYLSLTVDENDNSNVINKSAFIDNDFVWTNENAIGIFRADSYLTFDRNDHFWVELYSDGNAITVSTSDEDSNGTLERSEILIYPGKWQINELNQLVIRRYKYRSSIGNCEPTRYDPLETDQCLLYHERIWNVFSVSDISDTVFSLNMQHTHIFYNDPFYEMVNQPKPLGHNLWHFMEGHYPWEKISERPTNIDIAFPTQLKSSSYNLPMNKDKLKEEIQRELNREKYYMQ